MVKGSDDHREYMNEGEVENRARNARLQIKPKCTSLPDGFTPFHLNGGWREAPYLLYLEERGVTGDTVALYRMGYIDVGPLAGRVVIPSFDMFGAVNFWSARSIDPNEAITSRYRLPHASKDVISNEHMVDWTEPVYIVEGIFDEIAIGPQAISLYGKFMHPTLTTRLVERRPLVRICLDSDARNDARELMKKLVSYDVPCSIVEIQGKDPGSVGSDEITRAATKAITVTGSIGLIRTERFA